MHSQIGYLSASSHGTQLIGFELCGELSVGGFDKTQQRDKAGFHVLGHRANLGGRDVVGRHGLHAFEQGHVFGELLLAVPALQVGEGVAGELFLAVLQVGIAVDPPIDQIIALVVNQFDGAAATQTDDRCQC